MKQPRSFEELAFHQTPLGDLILRRRILRSLGHREIYEILLGDAYLMSSLFTAVEEALAEMGLEEALAAAAPPRGEGKLDVLIGGLGLGYTAWAALKNPHLRSLLVLDLLQPVIDWHRQELVPLGAILTRDARCLLRQGDFFERVLDPERRLEPAGPGKHFHAILLDIDHSPEHLLHPRHAAFYQPEGLRQLAARLHPAGVFALWSDGAPEPGFMEALRKVFAACDAHIVKFENPLLGTESSSTIYLASTHHQ